MEGEPLARVFTLDRRRLKTDPASIDRYNRAQKYPLILLERTSLPVHSAPLICLARLLVKDNVVTEICDTIHTIIRMFGFFL